MNIKEKLITWEEAVQWLKDQPDKQELVRHCYYDDPLESEAERFNQSEEWQAIKQLLHPYLPCKVLDLGAGRGISSYAFAKAGCEVTALEPDSSTLVGAKAIQSLIDNTNVSINIVQDYGETLPFPDNSFDIVYGRAVLHHAQNLPKLCQESSRVLRQGGVFIATREHIISAKEDLPKFLACHPLHHLYGGENAYLLEEYLEAIANSGFKLNKLFGPFDTVINYAPMTEEHLNSMVKGKIESKLPRLIRYRFSKLVHFLIKINSINNYWREMISKESNTPGRHYSFLALKN